MSDLIDRDKAIMALRLEYPMMPMFKSLREEWAIKTEGYRKAEEVIMKLPSARPNEGKWIDTKLIRADGDTYEVTMCNQCGFCASVQTDFCPNCGASMRDREGE